MFDRCCALAGRGGGAKLTKKHCVLLCFTDFADQYIAMSCVLCVFVVLGRFGVRFLTGHKSQKPLFYCRNVVFWVHPECPRGGSRGAPGRRLWDAKQLQKHCVCCAFSAGGPEMLIKPVVFLNNLSLGATPGDTFNKKHVFYVCFR